MPNLRPAAVAGTFYPADPQKLRKMLELLLMDVRSENKVPKAIIVPHAGYIYSGSIAASAYARLKASGQTFNRVVIIGPSHRVSFTGLAVSSAEMFATPLGNIAVDKAAISDLKRFSFIQELDQAHAQEHSVEVQLPFLQVTLGNFKIIPIVAGDAKPEDICSVLNLFWRQPDTLIVISSDLSHFHDYQTANQIDAETSRHIENLNYQQLDYDSACGRVPISGLLALAKKKSLTVKAIDLRNSGDTAGDKSRVVGYGAYVVV
jgi:AmmeMemoRadiSam system protein B